MRTTWIIAGCVVAAGLIGCERNEPVGQRDTNKTDTYGNVDQNASANAANKDQLVRDAEQQLNSISDEMHRWMESAGKMASTGGEQVANNYRESRDKMEKAADKARKELQELRQATGDKIASEHKEFMDAVAELRKSMSEAQQRVNAGVQGAVDNNAPRLDTIQPQQPQQPQNNVNQPGTAQPAPGASQPQQGAGQSPNDVPNR